MWLAARIKKSLATSLLPRALLMRSVYRDALELTQVARGHVTPRNVVVTVLANDSFRIMAMNRVREAARRQRIPGINHLLRKLQTAVHGIELGKNVVLGHGIWFVHPLGVVIGGCARVGDRVRFFGNNTVGTANENGEPVIEEDVWVGAGARILGPIRVGARARIGANAVVLTDVPPDSVAVGVPARVVASAHGARGAIARAVVQGQGGGEAADTAGDQAVQQEVACHG